MITTESLRIAVAQSKIFEARRLNQVLITLVLWAIIFNLFTAYRVVQLGKRIGRLEVVLIEYVEGVPNDGRFACSEPKDERWIANNN